MKRIVLIFLLGSLLGFLWALESGPSETVGYVKVDAPVGYTYFSLPLTFYDDSPTPLETLDLDDVIGTQLTAGTFLSGDRIIEIDTGTFAYLNSTGNTWSGGLTDFTDNKAYQFKVQSANPDAEVYLAGNVQPESQIVGYCDIGYTFIGLREAGEIDITELDLLTSGFTGGNFLSSDRLIDVDTGDFAYYNTGTSSWSGGLTSSYPAKVYQVKVNNSAFTWTYDPTTRGIENARITSVKDDDKELKRSIK